jgi:hypothetical protein
MTWWQRWCAENRMEEELEKEPRSHLYHIPADLIAQGLDREEARRRANLALGGPEQVKDNCSDAPRDTVVGGPAARPALWCANGDEKTGRYFNRHLHTRARQLARTQRFSAVINALLLRPLPFAMRISW